MHLTLQVVMMGEYHQEYMINRTVQTMKVKTLNNTTTKNKLLENNMLHQYHNHKLN